MKNMDLKHKNCWEPRILLIVILVVFLILTGCEKKEDIKVGFSGCLTGRLSLLGTAGRDGVLLAAEELNKAGGIDGRKIKVIVKDDRHDPKIANQVDRELIDEGVIAIIGHMTSSMSAAVLDQINDKKMILISPTSTSKSFTGKDDYFIRTALSDKTQTDHLVNYSKKELKLKKIAAIYDLSNQAFTEDWVNNFITGFVQTKGEVTLKSSFFSNQQPDYLKMTTEILKSDPQGVIIVAGALDTALISQHLKKQRNDIQLIASGWAKSPDLIKFGGNSVEGLILPQTFNPQSQSPGFLKFKKSFKNFTGQEPDFASTGSYDVARMLFKALGEIEDKDELKSTLLNQKNFEGVQGKIDIDQFGDAQRDTFMLEVKNGQFLVRL